MRGGGVWDSTGNGTVGWHVMCCHAPLCLSKQAAFTFLVFVLISPVECHPATQCVCTDRFKCVDIRFRCKANHFPDCAEGSEEKNCNITGKTVSAVVCWSWHFWVCCSAAIAVSLSTGSLVVPTQSYLSVGVCVCDSCHCCECDSALHSCTIPTLQRRLSQRCLPHVCLQPQGVGDRPASVAISLLPNVIQSRFGWLAIIFIACSHVEP